MYELPSKPSKSLILLKAPTELKQYGFATTSAPLSPLPMRAHSTWADFVGGWRPDPTVHPVTFFATHGRIDPEHEYPLARGRHQPGPSIPDRRLDMPVGRRWPACLRVNRRLGAASAGSCRYRHARALAGGPLLPVTLPPPVISFNPVISLACIPVGAPASPLVFTIVVEPAPSVCAGEPSPQPDAVIRTIARPGTWRCIQSPR